jgi:hypothetical protein
VLIGVYRVSSAAPSEQTYIVFIHIIALGDNWVVEASQLFIDGSDCSHGCWLLEEGAVGLTQFDDGNVRLLVRNFVVDRSLFPNIIGRERGLLQVPINTPSSPKLL